MNVEKTIEAILHSQLRAEQRADRADKRMDRFDKQLDATRKLVQAGIKMVVDLRKGQKETEYKIEALIDAQLRSDQRQNGHEDSMRKLDETIRRMDDAMRKNDQAMRRNEEATRRNDEKF